MRLDPVIFRELVAESPALSAAVARSMSERVGDMQRVASETPASTVTIIGRRWDPACHDLRDFLARNQVSFDWLDPDDPTLSERVPELSGPPAQCPIVRLNDGRLLVTPSQREVAAALGLRVDPSHDPYDLIIIGGGPAGLAAAVYGASEGLDTLMVEREAPGGQAGTSSRIENYLGFPAGLSGDDLGNRALQQAPAARRGDRRHPRGARDPPGRRFARGRARRRRRGARARGRHRDRRVVAQARDRGHRRADRARRVLRRGAHRSGDDARQGRLPHRRAATARDRPRCSSPASRAR